MNDTVEEIAAIFRRLRTLLYDLEEVKSDHDKAIVMIVACIDQGLNTGPRITGALERLGFNKRHIGIILKQETGNDPARHRWMRSAEGIYELHPESAGVDPAEITVP
jgi:hypothetical protein